MHNSHTLIILLSNCLWQPTAGPPPTGYSRRVYALGGFVVRILWVSTVYAAPVVRWLVLEKKGDSSHAGSSG